MKHQFLYSVEVDLADSGVFSIQFNSPSRMTPRRIRERINQHIKPHRVQDADAIDCYEHPLGSVRGIWLQL